MGGFNYGKGDGTSWSSERGDSFRLVVVQAAGKMMEVMPKPRAGM